MRLQVCYFWKGQDLLKINLKLIVVAGLMLIRHTSVSTNQRRVSYSKAVTHVNVNNTGACLRLSTFTSHNKNMLLNKLALFLRNVFIKGFKSAPQRYKLDYNCKFIFI